MAVDRSSEIQWREWGDEAFDQAEKQDKLILLDISAPWCHWCHVMDRTTYSAPRIIRVINERFIPVRVNADRQPDIQDRYLLGGWPTTAFLLPDGSMLSGTTFIPPEAMIRKLQEVDNLYHEEKALVTAQAASLVAGAEAERTEAEEPVEEFDTDYMASAEEVITRDFDRQHGGFGRDLKFPYPDAIRFALQRHWKTGKTDMLEIAVKTLDKMMGIHDPVWGGFYRYAMNKDWTGPHYEKMLYGQAAAIDNYIEAYQITSESRYGDAIAGVKAYVERFLSDPDGGFYASQDADIGAHDPDAELILGEKYFPLGEEQRLAMGVPHVDDTIYTDWNGMMISSYLRLYHAMGDERARDFALKTTDRILLENKFDDRMCHYSECRHMLCTVLSDQVYFGQALVDVYQSSGRRRYLDEAEQLAHFMAADLQDVLDGGFYFNTFHPHAKGEVLERHKPFDENVAAARFLGDLYHLTGREDYHKMAEGALSAVANPQLMSKIIGVGYALAREAFVSPRLHVVIVGDPESAETGDMLETALHAYDPTRLAQVLDPSANLSIGETTYEAGEGTLAYVCSGKVCHAPVKTVEALSALLEDVIGRKAVAAGH